VEFRYTLRRIPQMEITTRARSSNPSAGEESTGAGFSLSDGVGVAIGVEVGIGVGSITVQGLPDAWSHGTMYPADMRPHPMALHFEGSTAPLKQTAPLQGSPKH